MNFWQAGNYIVQAKNIFCFALANIFLIGFSKLAVTERIVLFQLFFYFQANVKVFIYVAKFKRIFKYNYIIYYLNMEFTVI